VRLQRAVIVKLKVKPRDVGSGPALQRR